MRRKLPFSLARFFRIAGLYALPRLPEFHSEGFPCSAI